MAALGQLVVNLVLQTASYTQGLSKSEQDTLRFTKGIQDGFDKANRSAKDFLGGLVGGAVAAVASLQTIQAIVGGVQKAIDSLDEISKVSQRIGVASDTLQELAYAGDLADVSLESLATGAKKLSQAMLAATTGSKEQAGVFRALGVELKNADGTLRSSSDVMAVLADRFKELPDGALKTALAIKVFGKAGSDLIPLLNGGSKGLRESAEEARKFGLVLGGDTLKSAEAFNDNVSRLGKLVDGTFKQVAALALPTMVTFTEVMIKAGSATGSLNARAQELAKGNSIAEFAEGQAIEVAKLIDQLESLGALVSAVGSSFKAAGANISLVFSLSKATRVAASDGLEAGNKVLQDALAAREKVFANSNKQWVDYLNSSGSQRADALRKAFSLEEKAIKEANQRLGQSTTELARRGRPVATEAETASRMRNIASILEESKAKKSATDASKGWLESLAKLDAEVTAQASSVAKLTAGEKLLVQLHENATEAVQKLTPANRALAEAVLLRVIAQEKANKLDEESTKAAQSFADELTRYQQELESVISGRDRLTKAQLLQLELDERSTERARDLANATGEQGDALRQLTADKIKARREDEEYAEDERRARATGDESRSNVNDTRSIVKSQQEQLKAMQLQRAQFGLNEAAVRKLQLAEVDRVATQLESEAALQRLIDKNSEYAIALESQADLMRKLASENEIQRIDDFLDPERAESFGEAMSKAFDGANQSIGRLATSFEDYFKMRVKFANTASDIENSDLSDPEKIQRQTELQRKAAQEQIKSYGDMAGAAKGFFKEGSKGYEALNAAEKTFRAFEIAMALENFVRKTFFANAEVAAVVAAEGVKTAAVTAGVGTQVAADTVKGTSAASVAVATQAQGDPYTAFVRMAAMAAAMAALGFATGTFGSKGSGGPSAAETQKLNGTGTVFGDADAKSESIGKSIEALEDTAKIELQVQSGMLASLKNIEASMAGLGNLLLRTAGITDGKNLGIFEGTVSTNKGDPILGAMGLDDFARNLPVIGGIVGKLQSLWGNVKQSISDSGLTVGGTVANVGVQQYAQVDTTKKSWFGLSKSTSSEMQYAEVSAELDRQFELIFSNVGNTLEMAATQLGQDAEAVAAKVSASVINIARLSLKDLSGEDLQAAIGNAIGAQADDIARAVLPGLDAFQRVGEGYFETLVRVSSGVETAQYALEQLGITAVSYTDILNKQGDTAAEIVRQSLAAAESASGMLSNVGAIVTTFSGSADDLVDLYGSLKDVQAALRSVGATGDELSVAMIRGAGGLDALQSSLASYLDNFFTDEERTAAGFARLGETLNTLGINTIPKTRDEFRALIEAQDIGTDSGAALAAKLLGLSDAFADLVPPVESVTEALDEAAEAAAQVASELMERLTSAIDANIGKFQTPEQRTQGQYQGIAGDLQGAGFNFSVDQLAAASNAEILAFVTSMVDLSDGASEAEIALVNAAGALADLNAQADQVKFDALIAGLEGQVQAITDTFGDLSVINEPIETLSQAFVRTSQEAKTLQASLDTMLGTAAQTIQETLADLLTKQKALASYGETLADQIQEATMRSLDPQSRVSALRGQETSLTAQFRATGDLSVLQKLAATSIQRVKEEVAIKQASADAGIAAAQEQVDLAKAARDAQMDTLRAQIDGFERLKRLSADIAQFTGSLAFSDLSPANFEQQLGSARSLFESTLAKAQGGDETAQGNLTGNARAFLDEARAYFASGAGYSAIFSQVTTALDSLGLQGADVDPQIAALEAQLSALDALNQTTLEMKAEAIDTSAAEVAAYTNVQTLLAEQQRKTDAAVAEQTKKAEQQIKALTDIARDQAATLVVQRELTLAFQREADAARARFEAEQNNRTLAGAES